jgi:hypothetical protein
MWRIFVSVRDDSAAPAAEVRNVFPFAAAFCSSSKNVVLARRKPVFKSLCTDAHLSPSGDMSRSAPLPFIENTSLTNVYFGLPVALPPAD